MLIVLGMTPDRSRVSVDLAFQTWTAVNEKQHIILYYIIAYQ